MSVISIGELKATLGWENIREETIRGGGALFSHRFRVIAVEPKVPEWPAVEFLFDDQLRYLYQLGFSRWHAHFDSHSQEEMNVRDAVSAAREFVQGDLCLVEQLDARGRPVATSLGKPGEKVGRVKRGARVVRRVFFNRPPEVEEVSRAGHGPAASPDSEPAKPAPEAAAPAPAARKRGKGRRKKRPES